MEQPSPVRDVIVRPTASGTVVLVALGGEIDLHRSPAVRNELLRLGKDRPARLVVDLSQVEYMDSSGVATLVQALQQVRRYGGQLLLVGPSDRVRSVFQIARLDSIFQIVDSRQEAERLISAQRDLSARLGRIEDVDEALRVSLEAVIEASGMDSGSIYVLD